MEEMATRMVEIANRICLLETIIVTERTARIGAKQHVQTLTAQVQTLTRNPTTGACSVDRADGHEGVEKAWQGRTGERWVERLGASLLSYSGRLDRNAMKNSAASETLVINMGLNVGMEQDSSSTLQFLLMMATTGTALDTVGNAGEAEGFEAWRRLV